MSNKLSKEQYLLICLIEECSEVQKAATKALRFGLEDYNPNSETVDNAYDIAHELYDIVAIQEQLINLKIIPSLQASTEIEVKLIKLLKSMELSIKLNKLETKGEDNVI